MVEMYDSNIGEGQAENAGTERTGVRAISGQRSVSHHEKGDRLVSETEEEAGLADARVADEEEFEEAVG